mgnify:CR=1 FL=1
MGENFDSKGSFWGSMVRKLFFIAVGVVVIALMWALPLAAQRHTAMPSAPLAATPNQVSFTLFSSSVAWMDNNNACSTPPQGPRAMWLAIAVTNNATETLTGVVAQLSGFTSAYFALTADPTRYVGNLAPGASYYGYWYVDYSGACPNPFNRTDQYTLTVTADNLSGPARYTGSLTTQSANDVGAGDIITASRGSGIAIGQVFTQVTQYQFPKASAVLIQPTGDSGFRDDCFRLVDVEVTQSDVSGIPVGTRHRLYFPTAAPKNNDRLTVQYFWQAQCQADSTSKPWMSTGTSSPGKYSNRYGVYFTTFPIASMALSITVSVTPELLTSAGHVTYTVRLRNTFTQPIVAKGTRFNLPSQVVYKGVAASSAIRNSNSSHYPSLDATGVLTWLGVPLLSYTVPASGTTTPGEPGTLDLVFTATAPAITGRYAASAIATAGNMDVGPLTVTFDVDLPTAVTLADFAAIPQNNAVLVTWETAAELDNAGFNLYRSTAADGPYTLLNGALIPPQFPGEVIGGVYEWLDTDVQPGVVYYYKLEDIDVKGTSAFHGPVSTGSMAAPSAVGLRNVRAQATPFPTLLVGLAVLLGLILCFFKRL